MKESAEDCLFEDSSENTNLGRFLWHCSEQESNCWKLFVRKTCVKSEAGRQEGEDGKFSVFFRLSFFAKVIASEAFQARNSCQTSLPAFRHNE